MKYIRSPLNYTGNKYKLLDVLAQYFPEDNEYVFCDVFGGSATVLVNNLKYKDTIYNEKSTDIFNIINYLLETDYDSICTNVERIIREYNLSKTNKEGYIKLRSDYNNGKRNPLLLYVLSCYSFNHQIRFNSKGEFNTPFGQNRSHYSEYTQKKIKEFKERTKNKNIKTLNLDFEECIGNVIARYKGKKIIFYLDPPYLITTGAYNDGKRNNDYWTEAEEVRLYKVLDELKKIENIHFVLSNVVKHKGKNNIILDKWAKKHTMNSINYSYANSNYQTKGKSEEVVVYG